MKYISTRGGDRVYTFEQAILSGWADNGGMLLPEHIPVVDQATLASWRSLQYPQLCFEVLRLYISRDELDDGQLQAIVERACSVFHSPATVVPVVPLDATAQPHIYIAELWHGPTLAFKDLGLQILGCLLDHFLAQRRQRLCILVGTSGDTGSAAIEAARDKDNMDIIVLFPQGRISHIQELQMTSPAARSRNVWAWACEGTSDDLDQPIAALFQDTAFKRRYNLGSLNSVNVARVLVQAVHYFLAFFACSRAHEETALQFVVPTGAGGHLIGGLLAQGMGLPIRLHAATNENDIMQRLIAAGDLKLAAEVVSTNSPSMDIQMPYNIERIFFLLYRDSALVANLMRTFNSKGVADLPSSITVDLRERFRLTATATSSASVLDVMRRTWQKSHYLLDPHTAVGVAAAEHLQVDRTVCMACAHPAKFPDTVAQALQIDRQKALEIIDNSTPKHLHVQRVLGFLQQQEAVRVLKKAEDWEAILRTHIENLDSERLKKS